ncbi:MAG: methylated-DNA--[protein]-cysteine S-methyltransferase [Actinomycetota bacterium]|nr:methylated-DNA--[protein]-cysteine S-methyltransferase [Actinomycetota bacterium]
MDQLDAVTVGTPLGDITVVAADRGVVATFFEDEEPGASLERLERWFGAPIRTGPRRLTAVRREVHGYFRGRLRTFATPVDLRLASEGFTRRVLKATMGIGFGELWTYGDVSAAAGSPRGGRAAGNALSRCPIELFVPCHRVVHASGTIGGYGRHEERKRWLIDHESLRAR